MELDPAKDVQDNMPKTVIHGMKENGPELVSKTVHVVNACNGP